MDIFGLDAQLIQRYSLFARSFSEIRAAELKVQIDDAWQIVVHFFAMPFSLVQRDFAGLGLIGLIAKMELVMYLYMKQKWSHSMIIVWCRMLAEVMIVDTASCQKQL